MSVEKFERRECDRCKGQVEISESVSSDPGWVSVDIERVSGYESRPIAGIPSSFDLCDKCCQSLVRWYIISRED
jgi:hypothetical protein